MQGPADPLPPPCCAHEQFGQRERAARMLGSDLLGQRAGDIPPPGGRRPERHPGRVSHQVSPVPGLGQDEPWLAALNPEPGSELVGGIRPLIRRVGVNLGLQLLQLGGVLGGLRPVEQPERYAWWLHAYLFYPGVLPGCAGRVRWAGALGGCAGRVRWAGVPRPGGQRLARRCPGRPYGQALKKQMNSYLMGAMGRISGVTAADTRERLLRGAAEVFARRGYDGTRVADIAAAAGVSNGALYAHFGSKAELLVAALRAHGRRLLADAFAADPDQSVTDLLLRVGRSLPRSHHAKQDLLVEALVAARRDEDVARPMRDYIGERADWIAGLVRVAQAADEIDPGLSPNALAHFCLLLAMGSALITPDMHAVGDQEWAAVLSRIAMALGPETDGSNAMKVQINPEQCQGHGRCYDLAPDLFAADDEGYGTVLGDGTVPPGQEDQARRAVANCPERAVALVQET
jgi:AcrR family transcriptional regulator/ferredoxin